MILDMVAAEAGFPRLLLLLGGDGLWAGGGGGGKRHEERLREGVIRSAGRIRASLVLVFQIET